MASPWICSSCRTRLPSIVRGARARARSVSQYAARRDGIGAVQERYGSEAAGGAGAVRGRYSGRAIRTESLRPETVLHELEDSEGQRDNERRRPRQQHSQSTTTTIQRSQQRNNAQNHPTSPQTNSRQSDVPSALILSTDAFIDAVEANNLPKAWHVLSKTIFPNLQKITKPTTRRNWLRKPLVQPQLHKFHRECTSQWLEAFKNGSLSTHTLPSQYETVVLLEQLGFGKPVFYRPPLWHLASEINDLRLTHPQLDLQPAIAELMKLWRLTNFAALLRARGKQVDISLLENKLDWSFLPPLTVFAQAGMRREFGELLGTVVPITTAQNGGVLAGSGAAAAIAEEMKTDWVSPALATLDLLRTTQFKGEDGRVGMCSEMEEYRPWVRLLETMLKAAQVGRVPVCVREKLVGETREEVRERWWRLLRRVGVKREVVEGEARSVEKRGGEKRSGDKSQEWRVKEESAATLEAPISTETTTMTISQEAPTSTTPTPQDTATLQDIGLQESPPHEAEPQTIPHIKLTLPPSSTPRVEQFALKEIKRLGRALEKSDIHQVEFIRKNIAAFASSNGLEPTALPIEVYEHLMMVLFALKNQKSAVEVWRNFIEAGYTPTVKTYTVLMQGASTAHDVTTMEKFWNVMRKAGLRPDAHAWSTRITCLFLSRLAQKGLAALSEMGKEWFTAARNAEYEAAGLTPPPPQSGGSGKKATAAATAIPEPTLASLMSKYPSDNVGGVPRPGVVVMNAAITSLANSQHRVEIPKVLHWGRTFAIEPDLRTYNALLNLCMRESKGDEALAILGRMQKRGIMADSTTWTVLLTALFKSGFLDDLSLEEQGVKIMDFIRSVSVPATDIEETADGEEKKKAKGIGGIDLKGYALIIDRLLKIHCNPSAAAEVLHYMVSVDGLRPNTQIYTILMTSYFFPPNNQPPDFAAIDTLWQQISTPDQQGHTPSLDPIFYDRMVEGYAMFHSVVGERPAMDFLARMSEKGMKPGFGALEAVGRMLAQRGEWGVLGRVVGEVRKRGRTGRVFERQRSFWEFVVGTGVLRNEGIESVEQILGEGGGRRGHWMDGR